MAADHPGGQEGDADAPGRQGVGALYPAFARRRRMDGERVDAFGELARQRLVDHAMALDPALPFEGLSHDINPEMGLAARPVPGMALMLVGFIDHAQAFRCESLRQLLRDDVGGSHRFRLGSRSGSLSR